MAFLLFFVLATLALPLSVELYKRKGDNVVSRAGREIVESKTAEAMFSFVKHGGGAVTRFVQAGVSVVVVTCGLATLWVIVRILWGALAFFMGMFAH